MKKKLAVYMFYDMYKISGGTEEMVVNLLNVLDYNNFDITLVIKYPYIHEHYLLQIHKSINIKSILKSKHGKLLYDTNKKFYYKWQWNLYLRFKKNQLKKDIEKSIYKQHLNYAFKYYDYIIDTSCYYIFEVKFKFFTNIKSKIIAWHHFDYNELVKWLKPITKLENFISTIDKLVLVNQTTKTDILKAINFIDQPKNIFTIYNGINFERINTLANTKTDTLSLEEQYIINTSYILMVARLSVQKDHITLIKSFNQILSNFPTYNLVLIGDFSSSTNIIYNIIKSLNLEHKVFILGPTTNPYIWLKHCKISILSTNFEGFGLTILESIILNKPVVVSDIEPCLEAINYGKCGFSFKTGNVNDLTDKILYLLNGSYNKEELLKNYNVFIQKFSLSNFGKEFNTLLKNMN